MCDILNSTPKLSISHGILQYRKKLCVMENNRIYEVWNAYCCCCCWTFLYEFAKCSLIKTYLIMNATSLELAKCLARRNNTKKAHALTRFYFSMGKCLQSIRKCWYKCWLCIWNSVRWVFSPQLQVKELFIFLFYFHFIKIWFGFVCIHLWKSLFIHLDFKDIHRSVR